MTLQIGPDGRGNIHLEGIAPDEFSKVRGVVERVMQASLADGGPGESNHDLAQWTRVLAALQEEGFGIEDMSSGDYQVAFEADLLSGRHLGEQAALHSFATPNEPLARKIVASIAGALSKIADDLAEKIEAEINGGDLGAIVAIIRDGFESGAFGVHPTTRLLKALLDVDVSRLEPADRQFVRERRLAVAHLLRRWDIAAAEAQALLGDAPESFDARQKAELEMVIANGAITKGHTETALHIWRSLLQDPATLGPDNRGWIWRNIALALPRDSANRREAAKYSADAFLEAGDKRQAAQSLMVLVNALLFEEPVQAINMIDEILPLTEQEGLSNRGLRAATFHARGNRLAKVGKHPEALADATQAIGLWRGLIGAEDQLISSLHLAATEARALDRGDEAKAFEKEADRLTDEADSSHFKLARRVQGLVDAYDSERAAVLLQDAELARNREVTTSVRVLQAMHDPKLSDAARLSMLEETLNDLDCAGTSDAIKQPVLFAIAHQLERLSQPERAEAWYRRILAEDPLNIRARDALIACLWRRKQWGDAAIVLKRQLDLWGAMPGLSYAYGRSLFEAGAYSDALLPLTEAADLAGNNEDLRRAATKLRDDAIHRGGMIRLSASPTTEIAPVTREEFNAELDYFAHFVTADRRMSFWRKAGKAGHRWVERPEKHAQDLLYAYLKARFRERAQVLEELASGAGRLDIYVQFFGALSLVIELKMCGRGYSSAYAAAGKQQILHYMENRGTNLGYLVVFDARKRDFGKALFHASGQFLVVSKFVNVQPQITPRR